MSIVINFAFMLLGGLHPMMWILMPAFIALFSGIPFMLMCAKVQKPGAVLLMCLITGLIYFATGQFTVVILVTFVMVEVSGVIRDLAEQGHMILVVSHDREFMEMSCDRVLETQQERGQRDGKHFPCGD